MTTMRVSVACPYIGVPWSAWDAVGPVSLHGSVKWLKQFKYDYKYLRNQALYQVKKRCDPKTEQCRRALIASKIDTLLSHKRS